MNIKTLHGFQDYRSSMGIIHQLNQLPKTIEFNSLILQKRYVDTLRPQDFKQRVSELHEREVSCEYYGRDNTGNLLFVGVECTIVNCYSEKHYFSIIKEEDMLNQILSLGEIK